MKVQVLVFWGEIQRKRHHPEDDVKNKDITRTDHQRRTHIREVLHVPSVESELKSKSSGL
jgi:hypothetical protein